MPEQDAWNRGFLTAIIIAVIIVLIMMWCKSRGIDSFSALIPKVDRMSIPKMGREYLNVPSTEWMNIPRVNY